MADLTTFQTAIDALSGKTTDMSVLTAAARDLVGAVDDQAAEELNLHLKAISATLSCVGAGEIAVSTARRSIATRKRLMTVAIAGARNRDALKRLNAFLELAQTAAQIAGGILAGLIK